MSGGQVFFMENCSYGTEEKAREGRTVMEQSEVARVYKCQVESTGKGVCEGESSRGGDWIRVSYERRDGRIQVFYQLFDSGGHLHCILNATVPAETECGSNNVDASS
jgi:hypothetical protein